MLVLVSGWIVNSFASNNLDKQRGKANFTGYFERGGGGGEGWLVTQSGVAENIFS